jgi:uncharacterized protein with WD repeat
VPLSLQAEKAKALAEAEAAAALEAAAAAAAAAAADPEKRKKQLLKKLRAIDTLAKKAADGESLDADQQASLQKADSLRAELDSLTIA